MAVIADVYVDERAGRPVWAALDTGASTARRTLVPLTGTTVDGDRLISAWAGQVIASAPQVGDGQGLAATEQRRAAEHYDVAPAASGSAVRVPVPQPQKSAPAMDEPTPTEEGSATSGDPSDHTTPASEPRTLPAAAFEKLGLHGHRLGRTTTVRSSVAELIGTFFLVFTGTATVAVAALDQSPGGKAATLLAVALAFGLVLAALVAALGHISGAHFNAAVTLGLAVTRKFPWRSVPAYLAAQLTGASLGAAATWLTFGSAARSKAHLGATFPAPGVSDARALAVEAFITFLLVFVIIATATDDRAPTTIAAPAIGFALVAAVLIGGGATGGAANPDRALGPMLVSLDLTSFWVYLVGPVAGGIAAAVVYHHFLSHADTPDV